MGLVEFSLLSMAALEGVCMGVSFGAGPEEDEDELETVCKDDLLLLVDDAMRLWRERWEGEA